MAPAELLSLESDTLTGPKSASLSASADQIEQQFQAALSGCVVLQQPPRVRIRVTGSDAQRWLNGMITNTAALPDGHGNYSFLLNAQGRLQGDAYLFRRGEGFILEIAQDQQEKLLAWLDRFIIMDDVELQADTELPATTTVAGPLAASMLAEFGAEVASLPRLTCLSSEIATIAVQIVRGDVGCVPVFNLWHATEANALLENVLLERGAVTAGTEAAELLRIASGVPLFGVDLQERDLPQETGQSRALHFSKGCYIGQEIVERIHSRGQVHRGWRGFVSPDQAALPTAGTELVATKRAGEETAEGKAIGKLTSVARLPLPSGTLDVALGVVRTQLIEEGAALHANGLEMRPAKLPCVHSD